MRDGILSKFNILCLVTVICIFLFVIYYFVFLVPTSIHKIESSSCEQLLKSIKTSTPNYQYDLREWVSKECWK